MINILINGCITIQSNSSSSIPFILYFIKLHKRDSLSIKLGNNTLWEGGPVTACDLKEWFNLLK